MEYPRSELNKVKRSPGRGKYDKKSVFKLLDSHFLGHLAYVHQDVPITIPTAYGRIEETIYLHGAISNRMLNSLSELDTVSMTVTHLDGLVLARSVFHHSMNYRSVVVFGKPRIINDENEKQIALEAITHNIIPGRWDESRKPNDKEIKSTLVLAIDIMEASVKIREGDPADDSEDYKLDIWAGVLPLKLKSDNPIADSVLKEGIKTPESVKNYSKF